MARKQIKIINRMILPIIEARMKEEPVIILEGPRSVGKSTVLKCLNRLVDLTPSLRVTGQVFLDGHDVRGAGVNADDLRRRVGIVFQQPVTFPGSILRNVLFAATKLGLVSRANEGAAAEKALRSAGIWDEVKDRLSTPALTLSVGQQQRLAIARSLAGEPDVLLMDEPTSALDPRSTAAIEETILGLKKTMTVVLVTHHLDQARRIADWVACICPREGTGELIEADRCEVIFESPARRETMDYLGLSPLPAWGDATAMR